MTESGWCRFVLLQPAPVTNISARVSRLGRGCLWLVGEMRQCAMYLDIWIHDYIQHRTIIYLSGSLLSISAASVSPVCAALADTVCLDILHS